MVMEMRYEVTVEFHSDFVRVDGSKIVVGLTSKPERGKSNRELVKKLAKHFKVSSSQVGIVSGSKLRRKIVEVLFG